MKDIIVTVGLILLGILIVGLIIGVGGNTDGSLAGSAQQVVDNASGSITAVLP